MTGRKICRSCNKEIGSKSRICKYCGFTYQVIESRFKNSNPISDKSGRGYKQCANCKKYVGIRHSKCPSCNHIFVKSKEKVVKVVKENKENTEIKENKEKTKENLNDKWDNTDKEFIHKYAVAVCMHSKCEVVLCPAGTCPVMLARYSENDKYDQVGIDCFCEDLVSYGISTRRLFTPQSIKYFGRSFFPINNFTYEEFCSMVNNWVERIMKDDE